MLEHVVDCYLSCALTLWFTVVTWLRYCCAVYRCWGVICWLRLFGLDAWRLRFLFMLVTGICLDMPGVPVG